MFFIKWLMLGFVSIALQASLQEIEPSCRSPQRVLFVCINPDAKSYGDQVTEDTIAIIRQKPGLILFSSAMMPIIAKKLPDFVKDWVLYQIVGSPGFVLGVPNPLPDFIEQKDVTESLLPTILGLAPEGMMRIDMDTISLGTSFQSGSGEDFVLTSSSLFRARNSYANAGQCGAPTWSIFAIGHGDLGHVIGMRIGRFKEFLSFLNNTLNVKIFAYTTCTSGNINLAQADAYDDPSLRNKKAYNFPIAFDALTDAPTEGALSIVPAYRKFADLIVKAASQSEIRLAIQHLFVLDYAFPAIHESVKVAQVARIRWAGESKTQLLYSSTGTCEITDMMAATRDPNQALDVDTFFKARPVRKRDLVIEEEDTKIVHGKAQKSAATKIDRIVVSTNYIPFDLQVKKHHFLIFASPAKIGHNDANDYTYYIPRHADIDSIPKLLLPSDYKYRLHGLTGAGLDDLLCNLWQVPYASDPEILIDTIRGTQHTLYKVLIIFRDRGREIHISWTKEPIEGAQRFGMMWSIDEHDCSEIVVSVERAKTVSGSLAARLDKKIEAILRQSESFLDATKKRFGVAAINAVIPSTQRERALLEELYNRLKALSAK